LEEGDMQVHGITDVYIADAGIGHDFLHLKGLSFNVMVSMSEYCYRYYFESI